MATTTTVRTIGPKYDRSGSDQTITTGTVTTETSGTPPTTTTTVKSNITRQNSGGFTNTAGETTTTTTRSGEPPKFTDSSTVKGRTVEVGPPPDSVTTIVETHTTTTTTVVDVRTVEHADGSKTVYTTKQIEVIGYTIRTVIKEGKDPVVTRTDIGPGVDQEVTTQEIPAPEKQPGPTKTEKGMILPPPRTDGMAVGPREPFRFPEELTPKTLNDVVAFGSERPGDLGERF